MTTVYIIRHAQAEGNLYRRCHGWYNSQITRKGHQQIAALSERFKNIHIDAVYSSDLYRTMTTAQAICRPHNLPLRLEPALREVGMGIWEDWTWGDALQVDRESMISFLRCDPDWHLEGSDTFPGVQERFCAAVEHLAKAHPDQTIACFTHGAAIRTAFARWMGLPIDRISEVPLGENTCVSCLEITDHKVHIRYYADDSHLVSLGRGDTHRGSLSAGLLKLEETALYFRPLDLSMGTDTYLEYRKDGWMASHGTMDGFVGEAFLRIAQRNYSYNPDSIQMAYANGIPVGMLQLDLEQDSELGIGRVPFLYICPEYRSKGFGIQLLGQAIYTFRGYGRNRLRLRCAPENSRAKNFYNRHGFYKIGEEPGGIGHLDTMELYIGIELK